MANRIEQARAALDACIREAYLRAVAAGELPEGAEIRGSVEQPKDTANGDFAANHAMASAKTMHMAPRKIAEALIAHMELGGSWFSGVEAAGPGFLNFRLSDKWYQDVLSAVESSGADYGRVDDGHGEKVMVEFVSANPTGPMTIGNARGGVLGDALASVLERAGYNVWREFYVNDAGNQVDLFGKSIEARYLQLIEGEDAVEFPDNGYHGDDIKALRSGKEIFVEDIHLKDGRVISGHARVDANRGDVVFRNDNNPHLRIHDTVFGVKVSADIQAKLANHEVVFIPGMKVGSKTISTDLRYSDTGRPLFGNNARNYRSRLGEENPRPRQRVRRRLPSLPGAQPKGMKIG